MIVDELRGPVVYAALHPGFAAAFHYLRNADFQQIADGRHELDGDRLFVIVAAAAGRGQQAARLEAHRKYIDIQYVIAGVERIGWKLTGDCRTIDQPFDEERDIMFFADEPQSWLILKPGMFAVFYPGDAHAPLAGEGEVRKAVMKIAIA